MPAGRPPKPSNDKATRGTLRKSRVRKPAEKAVASTVYIPQHLDSDERLSWQSLSPVLKARGMLTADFAPAFEQLCGSWARCRKLAATIRRDGMTYRPPALDSRGVPVKDADGEVVLGTKRSNPEVSILQAETKILKMWLSAFGLTPADLGRVELSADEPPTNDEIDLD